MNYVLSSLNMNSVLCCLQQQAYQYVARIEIWTYEIHALVSQLSSSHYKKIPVRHLPPENL